MSVLNQFINAIMGTKRETFQIPPPRPHSRKVPYIIYTTVNIRGDEEIGLRYADDPAVYLYVLPHRYVVIVRESFAEMTETSIEMSHQAAFLAVCTTIRVTLQS